ncbi:MAG: radical SAM protein [Calditrichota bacterium]
MNNRKKVLLYNPDCVFYTMPLALLALGSALDRNRYEVIVVDGRLEEDPAAALAKHLDNAICLGVTVLTGAPMRDALNVSRAIRREMPELPIVWGGWHPSLFPLHTLDEPAVDITVQGQGEETFRELVAYFDGEGSLEKISGISWRKEGMPHRNPPRNLKDMNELPEMDYNLIPVERFFELKQEKQFDYITSTGCFFRCAFCADPFVFKRKWTALEPQRIASELSALKKRYGFTDVNFQDETFFTYRKRVVEIAEAFIREELDITWAATMRADQGSRLTDKDFDLLKRSGLRRVLIGVESGSQEMMDWLKKDIKLEQVLESAERCLKHNINVIFPFIVGFPGETPQSVVATMEMVKRLRRMHSGFDTPIFYFKPYPGSSITADVVKNGYQLPQTLEEWAEFDYVGSAGPWVTPEKYRLIEHFKFYSKLAWGQKHWLYAPFRSLARWRCEKDYYDLPWEKRLLEWLRPAPELS